MSKWLLIVGFAAASVHASESQKDLIKKGRQVFLKNCVTCHGSNGDGKGPAAAAINPKPRNFRKEPFKYGSQPEEILKTITQGVPGTAMPSWASIPLEERQAVIQYVLTFKKNGN